MPAAAAPRGPGRPHDPAAGRAILGATLSTLAESGYGGLTMDRVAARAGVSKATIYRRWAHKREVVLAAVASFSTEVPEPDTGALRSDLTLIAQGLAKVFAAPETGRLVSSLLAEAAHDAELADALRSGFLAARRNAALVALERGRSRGEVREDADVETAVDLLAAPFYYRVLVTGAAVDPAYAETVVNAVLRWVAPEPGPQLS